MERQGANGVAIATVNGDGTGDRGGVIDVGAEDGGGVRRLRQAPGWDADPTWSPLGARLAYVHGTGFADLDVDVVDADGTDARPLAATFAVEHYPSWSPDGTRIAYAVESDYR